MEIPLVLTAYRDGDAVVVLYGDNLQELPAGIGPTLSAALRDLAEQLEKYGCNASAKDFEDSAHLKTKCHAAQERALGREPQAGMVWFGNKRVKSLKGHDNLDKKEDAF